jgi:hypothetical protein
LIGIKPNLPAYADFGVGEGIELGSLILGAGTTAYTLANQKKPVLPPSPVPSLASQDQSTQSVEEAAMRRQSIAGGIQSTIGPTGDQGAMMNPANLGQKTLLGQ